MRLFLKKSCVYGIYNNTDKLLYVGSTKNYEERFLSHSSDLNNGNHCNLYLQRLSDIYGLNNLVFMPLFFCDEQHLVYYETMFIKLLNPCCNIVLSNKDFDFNKPIYDKRFSSIKLLDRIGSIIDVNILYKKQDIMSMLKNDFEWLTPKRLKMYLDYYGKINGLNVVHSISHGYRFVMFKKIF